MQQCLSAYLIDPTKKRIILRDFLTEFLDKVKNGIVDKLGMNDMEFFVYFLKKIDKVFRQVRLENIKLKKMVKELLTKRKQQEQQLR